MKKAIKSIKKGFTLVELIVVILIIAILAGVATGSYFIYIGVANKSADQQTVANYNTALQTANTYLASGNETIEGSDGNTYYLEPDTTKNKKVDTANEAYTALVVAGYTMSNPKGYTDAYFVYVPTSNVFVIAKADGSISYSLSGSSTKISGTDAYYFVKDGSSVSYEQASEGKIVVESSKFTSASTSTSTSTSTPAA